MVEVRWDVPQSWAWVSMGDVAEVIGGGTPSTSDDGNFAEAGIPWLTPADLTGYQEAYISRGRRDLSEKGYRSSAARIMPSGTVLFSSRAPVGYCAIAAGEISTNQGFKSFVLRGELSPEYVRHYLLGSVDYAESKASGTTFKELSGSRAAELAVPLPPLPEQRRIVAKIDSLSGKSRRARDHLDHIPRLVEKYKQAVLAAAFEGRLAGCDFDWQERRLADVCKLVDGDRGANYPKRGDYHSEGHCLFLSTKNVRPNGFDFSECQYLTQQKHQEMRSGTLTRGDVVITTRGTVGNVAFYGDSVRYDVVRVNSGMLIMRPVPELSGDYLAWFVRSPQFTAQIAEQTTGSAQPQLPAGIMKRFSVRFPSIAQQPLVVQEIERALGQIDRLASEATSARRLIDRLDQAVLAKAFRGELVPQDHEDEPASVLVDRIRAERGAAPKAKRGRKTKAV